MKPSFIKEQVPEVSFSEQIAFLFAFVKLTNIKCIRVCVCVCLCGSWGHTFV